MKLFKFSLLKNGFIYLFSSVLSKSVPFLVLPIMTAYLTPEEYGKLSIFMIFISLYSAFVGMHSSVNIGKNYHKVSKELLSIIIGNMIIVLVINMILYTVITYFIVLKYGTIFSIPSLILTVIPLICVFNMVNAFNTTILRFEQRPYMYGVFEVSLTIIKVLITIYLLVVIGLGWYSQVFGIIFGGFVFFVVGLIYMHKRNFITFKFKLKVVKSILALSIPLIPHVLGNIVISMSDRLFIERMINIEEVGIYSVGYYFGMIMMLFTDAFIKAWSPWFYKQISNSSKNQKNDIVKYTYLYIIMLGVLTVLITIGSIIILPYFVDSEYLGASKYIFWITLGYAFRGLYQIFLPFLVHISKTSFLAISTVTAALVNLVLNYFLIDLFGAIGAAYATVASFMCSAALVFWYQQKNFYMPWFNFNIFKNEIT